MLAEIQRTIATWNADYARPMLDLRTEIGDAKTMDDMADLIAEARGKMYFAKFRALIEEFKAEERAEMTLRQADMKATVSFTTTIVSVAMAAATAIGLGLAWVIGASIGGPIGSMTTALRRLAEGDNAVRITGQERGDEIGEMAQAAQVFKENAVKMEALSREKEEADRRAEAARSAMMNELQASFGAVFGAAVAGDFSQRISAQFDDAVLQELAQSVNRLLDTMHDGVAQTGAVLGRVAEGDLRHRMKGEYEGAFAELQRNVNDTIARLSELVGEITAATDNVKGGSADIASGAEQLSSRAEQQASSLEETAATMEEISASIKSNADSAASAQSLAADASGRADEGGRIVHSAVQAMGEIEASSAKIADIISVIDGIAFQTNLLALNAAVEAARAGDAGKGFAVVASEVRALAQRSSEASRDIRALIETSAGQVTEGVRLVTETGAALDGIVASISQVEGSIRSIAEASREQATGAEEISSTVSHLDEMTQQNASLAEESAANARSLSGGAEALRQLVAFFKTNGAAAAETRDDAAWSAVETQSAAAEPKPRAASAEAGWREF